MNEQVWKDITEMESSDSRRNMGELWKHHAKWKQPDARGQVVYNSTYVQCPHDRETDRRQKADSQAKSADREKRVLLLEGYRAAGSGDEKVLELVVTAA